jgi:hypothetical protein
MLRYAHQMPPCYEQSFLEGMRRGGLVLPKDWQKTITLYNMSSLLDLLVRSSMSSRPIMVQDIEALISHGMKIFGNARK